MDTVTRLTERHSRPVAVVSPPSSEATRELSVSASYLLSENGRKASLLAGGDGRELQQITLQVPANRLHLVSVDKQGSARLKLRPRFEVDGDRRIVRVDAAPVYEEPPTVEELYRAAAKNHELENAYYAQRTADRTKRRINDRELRDTVAQAFLADPGKRALAHPPPSPKRCYIDTDTGRLLFDVVTDQGLANKVPPEAHRRFRADLRDKQERNRQERAAQLMLHEEKKRFIAAWIAANGSEEQKTRQAAGVLPIDEAIEAITDQVFAPLGAQPRYMRDGAERLRKLVAQFGPHDAETVVASDLVVRSEHAKSATADEWARVREFQSRMPGANVLLRTHRISFKRDARVPAITVSGILVTFKSGPFTLRREYAVGVTPNVEERSPAAVSA